MSHDSHTSLDTQPIGQSLLGVPRRPHFPGHTTNWPVLAGCPTTATLHWTHNRLTSPCWVSHDSHTSLDTQPIGQSLLGVPRRPHFPGHTTDWPVLAGCPTTARLHWTHNRLVSPCWVSHDGQTSLDTQLIVSPCWVSHDGQTSLDTQPIGQSLLGVPRRPDFTGHTTDWSVLAGCPTMVTLHWTHNRLASPCWVSHDGHTSLDTQPIGQSLLGVPRRPRFPGHTTDWSVLAGCPTTATLHWTHNRLVSPCWVSHDGQTSLDTQPIDQSLLGVPRW